jgi:flagellar biosynthetic protein FlhB
VPDGASGQERTELATPKRRRKARERGNVARSLDIASVLVFMASLAALKFLGPGIFARLGGVLRFHFGECASLQLTAADTIPFASHMASATAAIVLPVAGIVGLAGAFAHLAQTGVILSLKPLEPQMNRISPLSGMKRIFSLRSLVELAKNLMKLAIVGALIAWSLLTAPQELFMLMTAEVPLSYPVIFLEMLKMAAAAAAGLALLAIIDFFFQRWDYERQLMMTRQELKEEHKESEGDPLLKAHVRAMQREISRRRMMDAVRTADVVVTNPLRFAVALKYEPQKMTAPTVVAKGARLLAKRIRQIAREAGVPIVQDPPLARALYKACKVGATVPITLYKAVAELLAFVYRQREAVSGAGAR